MATSISTPIYTILTDATPKSSLFQQPAKVLADVAAAKQEGDDSRVEVLLRGEIERQESIYQGENIHAAPWAYEELAALFRRQGSAEKEASILARWLRLPGSCSPATIERFERRLRAVPIRLAKRDHRDADLESLLIAELERQEKSGRVGNLNPDSWPYEQLAVLYRRQRRYGDEIAAVSRWVDIPGASPPSTVERLRSRAARARALEAGAPRKRPTRIARPSHPQAHR